MGVFRAVFKNEYICIYALNWLTECPLKGDCLNYKNMRCPFIYFNRLFSFFFLYPPHLSRSVCVSWSWGLHSGPCTCQRQLWNQCKFCLLSSAIVPKLNLVLHAGPSPFQNIWIQNCTVILYGVHIEQRKGGRLLRLGIAAGSWRKGK